MILDERRKRIIKERKKKENCKTSINNRKMFSPFWKLHLYCWCTYQRQEKKYPNRGSYSCDDLLRGASTKILLFFLIFSLFIIKNFYYRIFVLEKLQYINDNSSEDLILDIIKTASTERGVWQWRHTANRVQTPAGVVCVHDNLLQEHESMFFHSLG